MKEIDLSNPFMGQYVELYNFSGMTIGAKIKIL